MEIDHIVTLPDEGRRAVDVLRARLGVSRTLAKRIRLYGALSRNGQEIRMIETVHAGDRLVLQLDAPDAPSFPEGAGPAETEPTDLAAAYFAEGGRILLLDPHLCVLEKPAAWLTHPTHVERRAVSTVVALLASVSRVHPVNRLDRGTSGLLIIALDPFAHHNLSEQARSGETLREYAGLIHGIPDPSQGRIDAPIGVDPANVVRRTVLADGKPAVTHYAMESTRSIRTPTGSAVVSLVRFRLETGRTHQIRVHCRHAGMPLVGDPLYGIRYGRQDDLPAGPADELDSRIRRQALHAARIAFQHPVGSEPLAFESPLPEDMEDVLRERP